MGFGIKTNLATGRNLNRDKSYNTLIKPVVESRGLECVRADEIPHSTGEIQKFWITVNKIEACFDKGDMQGYKGA